MFSVEEFNEEGAYIGAKIDAPRKWSKFHEETPTADIVRAHLKISNRGLDVIDAVPLPLCCAMGKTYDEEKAVGVATFDFTEEYHYVDKYKYSIEEKEWMESSGLVFEPIDNKAVFPTDTLKHGEKTSFADISPEVSLFDNTPLAKPIKNAIKYATICKSEGEDPSGFLRDFEKWWNLEDGCMDNLDVPQITEISYPRVAGSSSKNSSPIYGFDNYAGRVEIHHTGITRESFLTDMEESKGVIAVADFGRFNAFMRYVVPLSDCLPGKSRNAVRSGGIRSKWAISPDYAFKYRRGDFVLKLPDKPLPTVDAGGAAKPILEFLMSDEYCKLLLKSYSKVDLNDDFTIAGIDIKAQLIALKNRLTKDEIKPYVFNMPDVEELFPIQSRTIPNLKVRVDISQNIIEAVGSKVTPVEIISASIGAAINAISDSPNYYSENSDNQTVLCNALAETVSEGTRIALNTKIKETEDSLARLLATRGVTELFKRNKFANVIHYACSVNYIGMIKQVYKVRDKFSTITIAEIVTSNKPEVVATITGVSDALKSWAAYYLGKSWKLTERDTTVDMRKVVLYSSLARLLQAANYEIKTKTIKWPDLSVEIIRKATNYAKKNKRIFSPPDPTKSAKIVGAEIDAQLDPTVSFADLAVCIEANLDEFEYDLKKRKDDYSPKDVEFFPKIFKPPNKKSESLHTKGTDINTLIAFVAEQQILQDKYTKEVMSRDVYDLVFERISTLDAVYESAINWLSDVAGFHVKNASDLRNANVKVTPDDLSLAVKNCEIRLNDIDLSSVTFDDEEEEDVSDNGDEDIVEDNI